MNQIYSEIERQKDALSLIQLDKSVKHIYAIDNPLYCSALSDKCNPNALVYRSTYQSLIFNPEESARPLVVSGAADTYERTYPKYD
jgi:hypothetical protein